MSEILEGGIFFIRSKIINKAIHIDGPSDVVVRAAVDTDQDLLLSQLFQISEAASPRKCFHIINLKTKGVLDIEEGRKGHAKVLAWPNNNGDNQKWFFESVGGDFRARATYVIVNQETGAVLDLKQSRKHDGNSVIAFPRHNQLNQQWELVGVAESMIGMRIEAPGQKEAIEKIIEKKVEVEKIVEKVIGNHSQLLKELDELRELFLLVVNS